MKKLPEKTRNVDSLADNTSQTGFSNGHSQQRQSSFGVKEIKAYTELGLILRRIHKRMNTEQIEITKYGNSNQENKSEGLPR